MKHISLISLFALCGFTSLAQQAIVAPSGAVTTIQKSTSVGGAPAVVMVPEMREPGKQAITVQVANQPAPAYRRAPVRAVLVMQNHVQNEYRDTLTGLADALAAELSSRGFTVINPDNAIGMQQNRRPSGEMMPEASALQLCRLVNADCLLTASVTEISKEAIGDPTVINVLHVRMTLNATDGQSGATLVGATVSTASRHVTNAQLANNNSAIYTDLIHRTAVACAEQLETKMASVSFQPRPAAQTQVTVTCNVSGADVKVDGAAMGTAPATLRVTPGMHNLEVSYPFCIPYYAQANFQDGQTYNIVLQLNEQGRERWKKTELFTETLDRIRKTGATDDYVRKNLADGTKAFWENSAVNIRDGKVDHLEMNPPGKQTPVLNPGVDELTKQAEGL